MTSKKKTTGIRNTKQKLKITVQRETIVIAHTCISIQSLYKS